MVQGITKQSGRITNFLRLYRKKNGFSQKEVAHLMGYKTSASISKYESGSKTPNLPNLLKLETIYRTPVAFLFQRLCENLRKEIRREEERLKQGREKQNMRKFISKKQ